MKKYSLALLGSALLSHSYAWAQTDQSSWADDIDAAAAKPVAAPTAVAPPSNPVARVVQSMNPDVSAVITFAAGLAEKQHYSLAGDDPSLFGGSDEQPGGFTVQEAEIALQASVDAYFRADLFLAIPNLSSVEVEEGFITSTSLPANLQLKGGIFRSQLGRQNGQHLHLQDFARRPLINEAYLGEDGLRAPGVQLAWLVPVPFFLQLSGEALSVSPPEKLGHLASFGGGKRTDLTYTASVRSFVPFTDEASLSLGLHAAFGKTPGMHGQNEDEVLRAGARTTVQGIDAYFKYKPANQAGSYFSLAWTTELFWRQVHGTAAGEEVLVDGGLYSQLLFQISRRWYVGLRQDVLGLPASKLQTPAWRTALSATFAPTEFSRIRAYVERETLPQRGASLFSGAPNWAGYLQWEVTFGAHGAHPY
ncbi:MAG: hypothetical protein K1X64_23195 [Myxococcaceae bacterium]|nr:hypothetical protein [Myxococcaceae bacterium]